jgi:hypothetical protein
MTNYDQWKLATPNYLEDEDDRAISGVHSEIFDGEGGHDLHTMLTKCNSQDAGQGTGLQDVKKTDIAVVVMNAKRYGLLMDPVEFLQEERAQNQSPPPPRRIF